MFIILFIGVEINFWKNKFKMFFEGKDLLFKIVRMVLIVNVR